MNRNPIVIELGPQGLLSVDAGKGTRLRCVEGTLWITEARLRKDVVLEAGESYALAGAGHAVVQSMGASRVAVEAGAGHPRLAFPGGPGDFRLAA